MCLAEVLTILSLPFGSSVAVVSIVSCWFDRWKSVDAVFCFKYCCKRVDGINLSWSGIYAFFPVLVCAFFFSTRDL